jgi:hypothetical protein
MCPQPTPQRPQLRDDRLAQRRRGSLGRGKIGRIHRMPADKPQPQPVEDHIDVEPVAILQRDQCRRDAGPRVKDERKPPERLPLAAPACRHDLPAAVSRPVPTLA